MARKISVTWDHINRGRPRSPCGCAIALAAADAGFSRPGVSAEYINEWSPAGFNVKRWALPVAAQVFISCVDSGLGSGPIEFEVEEIAL